MQDHLSATLHRRMNNLDWKFTDLLLDLGLSPAEAKVYELLLVQGPMKASQYCHLSWVYRG